MKYLLISLTFLLFSCKQPNALVELEKVKTQIDNNAWDEAAYELKKMLTLGEENPRIYALYAYVQNRRGLNQDVEKFILKAEPTNAEPDAQIKMMIGRIYSERGEYSEAIPYLDQAFRLDPQNAICLKLLMTAEINNCRLINGSYDLKKYVRSAKALRYMMGRKNLRDEVFYNHAAIAEFLSKQNKAFMMPFLKAAENENPKNSTTVLNQAILFDEFYKIPKLARLSYARFLELTKGTNDPQRAAAAKRIKQLQGLI